MSRPDAFQCARPAAAAVGLGRRPSDEPERLPSDHARALRPARARPRLLFTRVVSPRTLSLAASHASERDRSPIWLRACAARPVKGWPVASSYLALVADQDAVSDTRARASRRERCVSPTSATDSTHEHHRIVRFPVHCRAAPVLRRPRPACRLILGAVQGDPAAVGLGACRSACRMSLPGGASLDGEPPASTIVAERCVTFEALARSVALTAPRGPGGVAIADSSTRCLPARRFLRRAELAISPLTSPVAILRGPSLACALPRPRRFGPPKIRFRRRLVKGRAFVGSGRLPSSECSLPLSRRTLSRLRVGSRGARHRSRCSRAGGFRHRDPASGACSLAVHAHLAVCGPAS